MEVATIPSECSWHLAQFKPNCALIAKRNLVRQGFEVFLPLESRTRAVRQQLVAETRPFFPGYLFVGSTKQAVPDRAIRSTYGISQLVCFGQTAAVVPQELVEQLKMRCDENGVMTTRTEPEKGERVYLATGPFADLVGEVEQIAADRRVWVLLDVMGQKTRVSVSQAHLQVTA